MLPLFQTINVHHGIVIWAHRYFVYNWRVCRPGFHLDSDHRGNTQRKYAIEIFGNSGNFENARINKIEYENYVNISFTFRGSAVISGVSCQENEFSALGIPVVLKFLFFGEL